MLQCVLQCVAVCCNVLQCDAVCCNGLQTLQRNLQHALAVEVYVCCSVLQCVALCCNVLQCVADAAARLTACFC